MTRAQRAAQTRPLPAFAGSLRTTLTCNNNNNRLGDLTAAPIQSYCLINDLPPLPAAQAPVCPAPEELVRAVVERQSNGIPSAAGGAYEQS